MTTTKGHLIDSVYNHSNLKEAGSPPGKHQEYTGLRRKCLDHRVWKVHSEGEG